MAPRHRPEPGRARWQRAQPRPRSRNGATWPRIWHSGGFASVVKSRNGLGEVQSYGVTVVSQTGELCGMTHDAGHPALGIAELGLRRPCVAELTEGGICVISDAALCHALESCEWLLSGRPAVPVGLAVTPGKRYGQAMAASSRKPGGVTAGKATIPRRGSAGRGGIGPSGRPRSSSSGRGETTMIPHSKSTSSTNSLNASLMRNPP